MRNVIIFPLFGALLLCGVAFPQPSITPLTLIEALPIEGPENTQPSGLTMFSRTLLAVSDKHDDTIFRIELKDKTASFVPHVKFRLPEPTPANRLDWEGITCDEEGAFYLVSESECRVLRVSPNGEDIAWVTPDLRPHGEEKGLFKTRGAGLEGICLLDGKRVLVCAEREPRGFIEVDLNTNPPTVRAFKYDETRLPLPKGRSPDFTGFWREDEDLYVLQRNAEALCKVRYSDRGLEERDIWSFAHIVAREDLRYSDERFGKAEGLCMDSKRVYIVLDNNGLRRASSPEDRRPLLLIMARP